MRNINLSFINKDIISLILSVFFSSIIFFSNESIYIEKVQNDLADILSIILYPKTWYYDILLVKEENKILSQKVVQLQLLNSKLHSHQIENEELRKMLSFKESYPNLSLLPANIVNHNFTSSIYSIIVDIGKKSNISLNQAVIDMNGLVGKTITVGNRASKIQMINDKNFAVSVKVGEDIILSIFKPKHGKYGYLEGVIKSSNIQLGDMVYTSGISEIYPVDIPVAKVINIQKLKEKPFQDVIVEILADIKNLSYVFIIQ